MKGDKYLYVCGKCNTYMVALQRADGMIRDEFPCVLESCRGTMKAEPHEYLHMMRATLQWRRPTQGDLRRARTNTALREQLRNGALLLKPWRRRMSSGSAAAMKKFSGLEPITLR